MELNNKRVKSITPIISKHKVVSVKAVVKGKNCSSSNDNESKNIITYLGSLVRNNNNIGLELISLFDNQMVTEDIYSLASTELRKRLRSYSGSAIINKELVFVALCLISLKCYDHSFYNHVDEQFHDLYQEFNKQKIENTIREIINECSDEKADNSSRIINAVLKNSLVPVKHLGRYYEFVFDIYEKNFNYDLPEELGKELRFVFEGIHNAAMSDGDDIHVTRKTYKLIAATKQLIAKKKNLDDLIELTENTLRIIDHEYWGTDQVFNNGYYLRGLEDWKKQRDTSYKKSETSKSGWRSSWEPTIELDQNQKIYLVTPPHNIRDDYNHKELSIYVFNKGKPVGKTDKLDIRVIIGGFQIRPQRIEVSCPLGELQYKVIASGEELYSSEKKLFRDVLVFDEQGKEIKNHSDYDGTALVCAEKPLGNTHLLSMQKHYSLSSLPVQRGDCLQYGLESTQMFIFSRINKPEFEGELIKTSYVIDCQTKARYLIYKKIECVTFETKQGWHPQLEINGVERDISTFKYKRIDSRGRTRWKVVLHLSDAGLYRICCFERQNSTRMQLGYIDAVIDPLFNYALNNISVNEGVVTIESSLLRTSVGQFSYNKTNFHEDFAFFEWKHRHYYWLFDEPFDVYRLDKGPWKSMTASPLWIGDVTANSKLEIYYKCDEVIPRTEKMDEYPGLPARQYVDSEWTTVPVGSLLNYKTNNERIDLCFMRDSNNQQMLSCYNKLCLNERKTSVIYDSSNKTLTIKPVYYGKGESSLSITKGGDPFFSHDFKEGIEPNGITIGEIVPFEEYSITYYRMVPSLLSKQREELTSYSYVFFNNEDFINKRFSLLRAEYLLYDPVNKVFVKKECALKNTCLHFSDLSADSLIGDIEIGPDNSHSLLLKLVNPVEVTILSSSNNGLLELTIEKDGDGLLLDEREARIMDSLEDANAPAIDKYFAQLIKE